MAKGVNFTYREKPIKKRPGVHSKNTSKKQRKKPSRGQGK